LYAQSVDYRKTCKLFRSTKETHNHHLDQMVSLNNVDVKISQTVGIQNAKNIPSWGLVSYFVFS